MSTEKCETCGTVLNGKGCLLCDAPVCCPKCSIDDYHALIEIRSDPRNIELLSSLKPITAY